MTGKIHYTSYLDLADIARMSQNQVIGALQLGSVPVTEPEKKLHHLDKQGSM